jgi:hypothetical protein
MSIASDLEQERTGRECAAYMSASRLQYKRYSPFKLIVQISHAVVEYNLSEGF